MKDAPDRARRALLGLERRAPALRPPWARPEADFVATCSRCEACLTACPERILIHDADGLPQVDFTRGGCTFCGACARACHDTALVHAPTTPWSLVARISPACLCHAHVLCESCRDACASSAIRWQRGSGRVPRPQVIDSACTGCGACVSVCPTGAISIVGEA